MSDRCTLTDAELIEACDQWVEKLNSGKGNAWCLNVPARPNEDPDLLFTELGIRFRAAIAHPIPKAEVGELDPKDECEVKMVCTVGEAIVALSKFPKERTILGNSVDDTGRWYTYPVRIAKVPGNNEMVVIELGPLQMEQYAKEYHNEKAVKISGDICNCRYDQYGGRQNIHGCIVHGKYS